MFNILHLFVWKQESYNYELPAISWVTSACPNAWIKITEYLSPLRDLFL